MEIKQIKTVIILSLLLAISLVVVSYFGAFIPETYIRDSASMAAQGIGQDIVNLFFVVPLLLVSLFYTRKGSRIGVLVLIGTLFYILYSFIIYCFGVYFNRLFLLYCLTLSLSLYAFFVLLYDLNRIDVKSWFEEKLPVRLISIYLIVVAVIFYLLWLSDIIPAIIHNTIPTSVSNYKLLVNPVHVIDIVFALPAIIITAILFLKKKNLAYILVTIALVFIILLTIALTGMVIMLNVKGVSDETSVAGIFFILSIISSILLILFFRKIKKE